MTWVNEGFATVGLRDDAVVDGVPYHRVREGGPKTGTDRCLRKHDLGPEEVDGPSSAILTRTRRESPRDPPQGSGRSTLSCLLPWSTEERQYVTGAEYNGFIR